LTTDKKMYYAYNPMLILSYLTKRREESTILTKIAVDIGISIGSAHGILKSFEAEGIVYSERVGRSVLYRINKYHPMVAPFRIMDTVIELNPLIEALKSKSKKIILFGSCASGKDMSRSDVDLFVLTVTDQKDDVSDAINHYVIDRTINPIIVDTFDLLDMETNDKIFLEEIMKGKVLWEDLWVLLES